MPFDKRTASDTTYHSRHSKRTLARAARIAECIASPGDLLDVGCNHGITSAYMLETGKANHVTGIELHADTVDEPLRAHSSFTLLVGNVAEVELEQAYDYVVYGAVHHHILNLFGLSTAIQTLQKLAGHCRKYLFFETGQLVEGGRWSWQAPMRHLFRTDEEHFFYLLRSIEHMISGFEVIGEFWIHGIRRRYLKIEMRQDGETTGEDFSAWPETTGGPWVRTFGSSNQELSLADDPAASDSPTHFWITGEPGRELFIKKHVHQPIAAEAEWTIGRQIKDDWAVQPVRRVGDVGALASPYLREAVKIGDLGGASAAERRRLAAAVVHIFDDARELEVSLPRGVLLSGKATARLIDVVDLNANNFLVVHENEIDVVRVVDFEMQSTAYAPRNRIHVARILTTLKQRPWYALMLLLQGWTGVLQGLLRWQFASYAERVVNRQPSLASLLVAEVRTVTGKILGRMLRLVGLD